MRCVGPVHFIAQRVVRSPVGCALRRQALVESLIAQCLEAKPQAKVSAKLRLQPRRKGCTANHRSNSKLGSRADAQTLLNVLRQIAKAGGFDPILIYPPHERMKEYGAKGLLWGANIAKFNEAHPPGAELVGVNPGAKHIFQA